MLLYLLDPLEIVCSKANFCIALFFYLQRPIPILFCLTSDGSTANMCVCIFMINYLTSHIFHNNAAE